jgi:hypothetical protein
MRLCESCIFHARGLINTREGEESEDDEEDKQPIQDIQSINEICKNSIDILNFLF